MFRSALRKFLSPKSSAPIRKTAKAALRMETLEDRTVPANFTVGSGGLLSIQAALNAAAASPGSDTVNVPAGTYTEALVINDASPVTLKAIGAVTIKAPATVGSPAGLPTAGGAVIDIYSSKVTVDGFKVDGKSSLDGSSPIVYSNVNAGIRVIKGGSATIKNNTVTNIINPADTQSGNGIQIGLTDGGLVGSYTTISGGTAKVNNNTVSNYLGAGVIVDGGSASATIKGNTITGRGTGNGGVQQFGVQISRAATARVESNTISGNDRDGAVSGGSNNAPLSAGIFFYADGGKNSVAAKNTIFGNDDGILVQDSNGTCGGAIEIVNNDIYGNNGYAGIDILRSNNVDVENNDVFCNTSFNGIGLTDSSNVEVEGNYIANNANADGIYVFGGANNKINCNESFSNGFNGILLENSVNNQVYNNSTHGNADNGVKVLGGSSNDLWLGDSYCNIADGILLQDTVGTTVVGNALLSNGGYGLRLVNADNTFIAFNLFGGNDDGSVSIDSASTGTVQIANRTTNPPCRDGGHGSSNVCSKYLNSYSHADDDCNGLDD